jgi:hypothetical protein
MSFVHLYAKGEGCEIPKGSQFLMVVSQQVDPQGNWIPDHVLAFTSISQVRLAIRKFLRTESQVVIRASAAFSGIAKAMGLRLLSSEWGSL